MTTVADFIPQAFVKLALALDQHIDGYIDAYYGPPEWRQKAEETGPRPVADLAQKAADLASAITEDADLDPQRRHYLSREVRAMQTSLRLLQGEQVALVDEVKGLYDVTPEWVDESVFEKARLALEELLPPGSSLHERAAAYRKQTEIPVERLEPLLQEIAQEFRRRTRERFPVPAEESFELRLVSDKPWRAYSRYLGDSRSRIDINTDLPYHITELSDLIAHEAYPGHHTAQSIKDAQLLGDRGWMEHCIALSNAPSAVVSEGIAVNALSTLMTNEEVIAWHAEELFPRAGFEDLDAERDRAIFAVYRELEGVLDNAAFLLHEREAREDDVIGYLEHEGVAPPEEAAKAVEFFKDPISRSYVFTYRYGRILVDDVLAAHEDRDRWFTRLLSEPVTPSQLRQWALPEALT